MSVNDVYVFIWHFSVYKRCFSSTLKVVKSWASWATAFQSKKISVVWILIFKLHLRMGKCEVPEGTDFFTSEARGPWWQTFYNFQSWWKTSLIRREVSDKNVNVINTHNGVNFKICEKNLLWNNQFFQLLHHLPLFWKKVYQMMWRNGQSSFCYRISGIGRIMMAYP